MIENLMNDTDYLVENYVDSQSNYPLNVLLEMNDSKGRTIIACENFTQNLVPHFHHILIFINF